MTVCASELHMSKTILFIIHPSPSHYHSTLEFARSWQKKGYKVVYTGTADMQNLVQSEGFIFYLFDYLTEYIVDSLRSFFYAFVKSVLDCTFCKVRYKDFYKNCITIDELISTLNPNKVFIDEHLSEYCIYLKKRTIDVSILCTKISSRRCKGVPPMNSYYAPNGRWHSNFYCELLWSKHVFNILFKKLINIIAFLGYDDGFFLKRYGKKYGFNVSDLVDNSNYFFTGVKGVKRIIMGTSKLEISWRKQFDDETYFFSAFSRNEQNYITPEYHQLMHTIIEKREMNYKIIYCSFGTVSFKNLKRVNIFMQKLLSGIQEGTKIILVISSGKIHFRFPNISNVYYMNYIPQLHFLQYCDLMITHGGHNSIKECIQANIPMLVYPHIDDSDQPGNAMRVYLNGFGLRGNIIRDSSKLIWKKINLCLKL